MNAKRFAIISDLHSNLEAVTAVLEDIKNQGVEELYCLGDVIGYGPNPNEVLSLSEKFIFTIIGNHEEAVLSGKGLEDFNPIAAQAVLWTRDQIFHPSVSQELSAQNKQYLKKMKKMVKNGFFLFAHGSATGNMEYIKSYQDTLETFKYMAQNKIKVCFIGHTHRPGIFSEGNFTMIPSDTKNFYTMEENKKMIVNVGSVGQSRDYNSKACYVIVDDNRFYYRRVEYDVDKTIKKIYGISRLDNYLGDRLKSKDINYKLHMFY
tara:strand:- start:11075 stop:11863 length:789 start_codon:yes stop_codon:yes gene_type:complete